MRNRYSRRRSHNAEVNLTSLIDTALTLLIIFMVTTPVMQNAIRVQLPKGNVKEGSKELQNLIVSIDEKGTIFFNSKEIPLTALGNTLRETIVAMNSPVDKSVLLRVNGPTTTCDTLVSVIDEIKNVAGIKDVNIATQKFARAV